jgi:glycosyltransferase involved in cell wall biosynthesis
MESLRICYLSRNYGSVIHGPALSGTLIIDGAVKKGHEVSLITPDRTRTNDKINFIYVKEPKDKKHATWIELSKIFSDRLKGLNQKFDVVHFLNSLEIMRYGADLNNVVTTIRGYHFAESKLNPSFYYRNYPYDWYKRYPYYNLGRFFERRGLRKMAHILAVSDYMKGAVVKAYDIDPGKVSVVPNGIEVVRDDVKRDFDYRILFVGNNFQGKGLPTLVDAVKILRNEFPSIKVTVVGDDKALGFMKNLVSSYGLAGNFVFTGHVDHKHMKEYYKDADLFVLPSLIESFGLVFIEAMNYGLPVIGSDVGGIPEIIRDGKDGFVVKPFDHVQLAEKMRLILTDSRLRASMSRSAYKRAEDFDVKKTVDLTIKSYGLLKA